MREIKFRIWNKASGKMSEPWNITTMFNDEFSDITSDQLMQYTGLKDKNGKEIYEGDLFGDKESYSIVEWSDTEALFLLNHVAAIGASSFANIDYHSFEVIGNIYENPELVRVH